MSVVYYLAKKSWLFSSKERMAYAIDVAWHTMDGHGDVNRHPMLCIERFDDRNVGLTS